MVEKELPLIIKINFTLQNMSRKIIIKIWWRLLKGRIIEIGIAHTMDLRKKTVTRNEIHPFLHKFPKKHKNSKSTYKKKSIVYSLQFVFLTMNFNLLRKVKQQGRIGIQRSKLILKWSIRWKRISSFYGIIPLVFYF